MWFLLIASFSKIRNLLLIPTISLGGGGGGGGSPRNCRWGVTLRFLNGDAIPDESKPFFIRLYALVVPLKTIPDFRL